jgi:hypothetical protein
MNSRVDDRIYTLTELWGRGDCFKSRGKRKTRGTEGTAIPGTRPGRPGAQRRSKPLSAEVWKKGPGRTGQERKGGRRGALPPGSAPLRQFLTGSACLNGLGCVRSGAGRRVAGPLPLPSFRARAQRRFFLSEQRFVFNAKVSFACTWENRECQPE